MTYEEFDKLPFIGQVAELVSLSQRSRYGVLSQSGRDDASETLRHFCASMSQYDLNDALTALEEAAIQLRYHWRRRSTLDQ